MKSIDNFTRNNSQYRHNNKITVPERTVKKVTSVKPNPQIISRDIKTSQKPVIEIPKKDESPKITNISTAKKRTSKKGTGILHFLKKINRKRKKVAIVFIIVSLCFILVGLISYNFSSILVMYSSLRSGIQVTYPEYIPSNYYFKNKIDIDSDSATLYFETNSKKTLSIKEEKSLWDSNAVRSYVDALSNSRYVINQESGLTIFIYNNKAYWVNAGILYTVSFNNKIDNSIIRSIAVSL